VRSFVTELALHLFETAVQRGEVLLEWDYGKGEPPKPLLKVCVATLCLNTGSACIDAESRLTGCLRC